ncbi:MAG TPA: hypothetical protein VM940_14635 [Chthoniobacterales bacterium]|jgi:hypothetical protein|nr:hypothetical protein [Chthoniobacterales bacterium]
MNTPPDDQKQEASEQAADEQARRAAIEEQTAAAIRSDKTQQAIDEIQRLTNRLVETSRATLSRAEEDRALHGALQELRNVARDVANNFGSELRAAAPSLQPGGDFGRPTECGCGCGPSCEIVSPDCCCFEIVILRARVIEAQRIIEPADAGGGGALELIFNVLADGQGEVYPSLASFIAIEQKQKWVAINKVIRKMCVRCGETRSVPLTVEVMEVEENVPGGRPEFGTNFGTLTLKCGCLIAPEQVAVDLSGGGVAGGEVLVEVGARQI